MIREVGVSPAMLSVVAGIDGGVSRRLWNLRQQHLRLESWWLGGSRHWRRGPPLVRREMGFSLIRVREKLGLLYFSRAPPILIPQY